jgi:hypothetical protein
LLQSSEGYESSLEARIRFIMRAAPQDHGAGLIVVISLLRADFLSLSDDGDAGLEFL